MKTGYQNNSIVSWVLTVFCFLLLASFAVISCAREEDCDELTSNKVNIKFYTLINGEKSDTAISYFTLEGLNRPDTLPDSLLYSNANNIEDIKFNLAPEATSVQLVFVFDSIAVITASGSIVHMQNLENSKRLLATEYIKKQDTLLVNYFSKIRLLAPECGFIYDYQLDTVISSTNAIDSISIVKKVIDSSNEYNIEVYY